MVQKKRMNHGRSVLVCRLSVQGRRQPIFCTVGKLSNLEVSFFAWPWTVALDDTCDFCERIELRSSSLVSRLVPLSRANRFHA